VTLNKTDKDKQGNYTPATLDSIILMPKCINMAQHKISPV